MTKTVAFVLPEFQIEWLKKKAEEAGGVSASSVVRKVISDAILKEPIMAGMPLTVLDQIKGPECEVSK